jgi:hypothetical protein
VSWPTTAASATTITLSGSTAATADEGYTVTAPSGELPAGSYVTAVSKGSSWTVVPPVGAIAAAIAKGTAISSVSLKATATALTIPSGTTLTIVSAPVTLTVTTSGAVTTSTSAATTVPVASVTPDQSYAAGCPVRGSVGQTWGAAISAASALAVRLTPPAAATVWGQISEDLQAAIIREVFRAITVGVPAGTGSLGSAPWPYVGPVFLFTWSDAGGTAGPFGLVRADGTPKAALAALTAASLTGGP